MTAIGGRGDGHELTVDREDFEANGLNAALRLRDPGGCWAVYAYDMATGTKWRSPSRVVPYIVSVYPTKSDALRVADDAGAGAYVVWLPWGINLPAGLSKAAEATTAQAQA